MLRTLLAVGLIALAGCAQAQEMRPRSLFQTIQRPTCSPVRAFLQDLEHKGYIISVVATRGPEYSASGAGNFVMAYNPRAWVAFIMNGAQACYVDSGSRYRTVDQRREVTPQSFTSPTPESEERDG